MQPVRRQAVGCIPSDAAQQQLLLLRGRLRRLPPSFLPSNAVRPLPSVTTTPTPKPNNLIYSPIKPKSAATSLPGDNSPQKKVLTNQVPNWREATPRLFVGSACSHTMRRSVMIALSCLCGGSLAFSAGAKSVAGQRLQNAASPTVLLRQMNRRSDQQSLNMLSADKPLKIGVVGVTGAVGVEIIDVLGVHRCWKAAQGRRHRPSRPWHRPTTSASGAPGPLIRVSPANLAPPATSHGPTGHGVLLCHTHGGRPVYSPTFMRYHARHATTLHDLRQARLPRVRTQALRVCALRWQGHEDPVR